MATNPDLTRAGTGAPATDEGAHATGEREDGATRMTGDGTPATGDGAPPATGTPGAPGTTTSTPTRPRSFARVRRRMPGHQERRLRTAREHIFSTGLPDSGAELGLANMQYGIAKIHWVQEELGLPPRATFVSAPDLTVTRNTARWDSGFGYGGLVTWGDGTDELVILDLKPNACGIIVGGLDELPDRLAVLERLHDLNRESVEIDGVPIDWDLGKSNHYVDLFRLDPVEGAGGEDLPPFAFMMHFSGDELRGETDHGPGLYWDRSPTLREWMEVLETPFGPMRILTGSRAVEYVGFFRRAEDFVRRRRIYAARRLFGDFTPISNDTHQGLVGMNRMVLGSYRFTDDRLFPMGFRPELPAYLVRGRPNLSMDVIERLGFAERAGRHDVLTRLTSANLLPHGGGYVFPEILDVARVHEIHGRRYFEVDLRGGGRTEILDGVGNLPFAYRGREVLVRARELGMAEPVARLQPRCVLKV